MLKLWQKSRIVPVMFLHIASLIQVTIQDIPILVPGGGTQTINTNCVMIPGTFLNVHWLFWRDGDTSPIALPDYSEISTDNTAIMINGVLSRNEGLYSCSVNGGQTQETHRINITVLGVPSFVGCDNSALMCSPGVQRNVTEGSSIELSISLLFKSGGSRGVNQTITFVILHRSDTPIFICKSQDVTGSCSVLPGTNYTDRITYSGRRFPWTDIYVSINNSVASDSGIFVVQVNSHNPNGDRTEQRFSSITISVTEIHVASTLSISSILPTVTEVLTTSLQSIVNSMGEIILPVEASSSPLSVSVTDVSVTSYLLSRTTRLAPIQSKALFTTAAAMSPVQSDLLGERSLSQDTVIVISISVLLFTVLLLVVLLVGAVVAVFCGRSRHEVKDYKNSITFASVESSCDPAHLFKNISEENVHVYFSHNIELEQNYNSEPKPI